MTYEKLGFVDKLKSHLRLDEKFLFLLFVNMEPTYKYLK